MILLLFFLEYVLLFSASIGIGIISSMIGLGGGSLLVPLLILGFGMKTHMAIGTSLFVILFTSISATFAYSLKKLIDFKISILLSCGTIPGVFVGAYSTQYISSSWLITVFSILLLIIAIRMLNEKRVKFTVLKGHHLFIMKRNIVDCSGNNYTYHARVLPGIVFSCIAGLTSGLLGIGGGIVMVPTLVLIVGMPILLSIAGSLFIICLTSFTGVSIHWLLGQVHLKYALALCIGTIIGAQVGTYFARHIRPVFLTKIFSVAMIVLSLRMLLLGLSFF